MKYLSLVFILCSLVSAQSLPDFKSIERERVIRNAQKYLADTPVTITAFKALRSAGDVHDYYSDSDYWWPDPKNPDGPYIRKDGMTNPDNFNEHRRAVMRLSVQVAALVSAFRLTGEKAYAYKAIDHLRAWFIADNTRMAPHLSFAQAVKGKYKGRGVGIIDTIHLIEVARSVEILHDAGLLSEEDFSVIKKWFADYLLWMNTHPNGIEERDAKNNHGTCWVMQAAMYARLTGNDSVLRYCRDRFKTVLLPNQMAKDGSFPLELERTKPYSYSLFNLEVMVMTVKILSLEKDNLWDYTLPDGRNIRTGIEFMYPYIKDKTLWKYPPDVMYFNDFPARQTSLLFCGIAFSEKKYIDLWRMLNADPDVEEVIRNFPIRQPLLWIN